MVKRMIADFPPRCGEESNPSERGDMFKRWGDGRCAGVFTSIFTYGISMMYGAWQVGTGPRHLFSHFRTLASYSHAQSFALVQQTSPFKGKTRPVPIRPPTSITSSCHHHPATSSSSAFPRSEHESPVFRQNHVRRVQRRSKERSRIHFVLKESSPQAGE